MKTFKTLETRYRKILPKVTCSWRIRDNEEARDIVGQGSSLPVDKYADKNRYTVMEVWNRIRLKDIIDWHLKLHPSKRDAHLRDGKINYKSFCITFTSDGIPLAKSSPDNLHVFAISFRGCRLVYVIHVRVADRRCIKDLKEFLLPFLHEAVSLSVCLAKFLGDAPMRAMFKLLKQFNGRYSCEVCYASGQLMNRQIVYPSSQVHGPSRTHETWLDDVDTLAERKSAGEKIDNVRGVTGASPLLMVPGFDMVRDCPSDPLHRDFLGVTRALWKLIVCTNKSGVMSAAGQYIRNYVSAKYRRTHLPTEFSHRSREVDAPNFKAHEWKTLIMTSFLAISEACEEKHGGDLPKLVALYAFLLRVYVSPPGTAARIGKEYLQELHTEFYDLFEQEFGPMACRFNVHSFFHMPEVVEFGKMTEVSTEPYESAYGHVLKSFVAGTRNIGLQILRKMMLRVMFHTEDYCSPTLNMAPRVADVQHDDSLLCDNSWNFYKVLAKPEGPGVHVQDIITEVWQSPYDARLPYHEVGVKKLVSFDGEKRYLPLTHFTGKAALYEKVLLMGFHEEAIYS